MFEVTEGQWLMACERGDLHDYRCQTAAGVEYLLMQVQEQAQGLDDVALWQDPTQGSEKFVLTVEADAQLRLASRVVDAEAFTDLAPREVLDSLLDIANNLLTALHNR